ncbi:hypothetical protein RISK_000632 [Rhodopirellula islandica]|uniref:Transmembrane protein n=1 Tax=Rhodopirellula islandica TaxID=595434 RepID=A0A0J1EPZ2_RHOIS|nr:hypothetical protein RISK_000632 [Rhodopirellula islandica]
MSAYLHARRPWQGSSESEFCETSWSRDKLSLLGPSEGGRFRDSFGAAFGWGASQEPVPKRNPAGVRTKPLSRACVWLVPWGSHTTIRQKAACVVGSVSKPLNPGCRTSPFELKETCVDFPAIVTAIFGAFVVFGGVMGYVKAKSKASLIAGGITGGLLLLSAFLMARGITAGAILGIVVSLLLIGQFGPSLAKKFKVMPNLLVVILGLITLGTLVFSFFR